ncbi:hypothetical protein FKN01_29825 [Streptomyces sp. 130]|uniref:hypothetical protein n=1 Tax=Streptomyces sp. 130 TaxID=2591006 RepID=UPI00117D6283|nr:hypothetical protein [Streptomyces sp. 130]TRV72587.1 hypothetical protein FKN01_29825 [Streptomyces sp. 130]
MGITSNRGYPYPDLSSPTTVAADLEALATAYDADLKTLQDGIGQRPMFRATGGSTRQEYGAGPLLQVSYEVLEENSGGALWGVSTQMPRDSFIPFIPGIWLITATVSYSRWVAPGSVEWVKLRLFSSFEIAGASANVLPGPEDRNRTLSVTSLYGFDGTAVGNPLYVAFEANDIPTRPSYAITSRSLTATLVSRD